MSIIKASLKLNIAIEEYNNTDPSDWMALKKANDKVLRAKCELQATKLGLRKH